MEWEEWKRYEQGTLLFLRNYMYIHSCIFTSIAKQRRKTFTGLDSDDSSEADEIGGSVSHHLSACTYRSLLAWVPMGA